MGARKEIVPCRSPDLGKDRVGFLKRKNISEVLGILEQKSRISRAELARATKLSPATISNVVTELHRFGLVRELGHGESLGGRRPILIEFDPEAFYLAGVDLGITKVIAIVADLHGRIVAKAKLDIEVHSGRERILSRMFEATRMVLAGPREPIRKKVAGLGLSVPGLVDPERGLSLFVPNIPDWQGVPLVELFKREFGIPTYLENDARAMALGEARYGAGKNCENLLCVNIGHGIGCGIIINGELYRGTGFTAGEIGHITIIPSGPLCHCGNRGCLEVMAGGHAISASAIRVAKTGVKTLIRDLVGGEINMITAEVVFEAAKRGDSAAQELLKEAGRYIGIGLASAVNLLGPEMIVIGGGVARAGAFIIDEVSATIKERAFTTMALAPVVVPSALGEDASCIGACAFVMGRTIMQGEPVSP